MGKVPLQNTSPWSHMRTVEEASNAVSRWPEWKRERKLFSSNESNEVSEKKEKMIENRRAARA
jgi:hypothetical protein